MVIVLNKDCTEEQKKNLEALLEKKNLKIKTVSGEEDTILAAVGKVSVDLREIEAVPGVERVIPISKTSVPLYRVAYCGKPGCNAEAAAIGYFDKSAQTVALDSFDEVFLSVENGSVDYGMIPIENSLGGSVYQNYDNFMKYKDAKISGAIAIKISYCLLGVKGAKLSDIKKVYSHPQALLQTRGFLGGYKDWQQIEAYNTSGAALFVSDTGSTENAAVASKINASIYGLDILAEGIEDDPNNFTRFVVISKTGSVAGGNMASFMFKAKNEPGSLYRILGVLNDFGTNLTRLESRPIPGRPWEYQFYADADLKNVSGQPEKYVEKIIEKLKEKAEEVRLLGVYSEVGR
ncbi:MAG: prephenate dehydratase domain-containing protein [Spirochaetales bacterium]|nr:prephenate dehydratase domain-containing protein [Spirochaetales bacterium]